MTDQPNNPLAFPSPESMELPSGKTITGTPGMTLREYFAGQALAGICADPSRSGSNRLYAEVCYGLADAMLAAREGGGE